MKKGTRGQSSRGHLGQRLPHTQVRAGTVEWLQENLTATYDATKPTTPTNTPFPKGSPQNWGNAVRIRHPGGVSWYFHIQPDSVLVNAGDTVRCGQPIATSGNIGRTSEPTHSSGYLEQNHLNVRDGSNPVML